MKIFNQNNGKQSDQNSGRPNLKAIEGAVKHNDRPPDEFKHGSLGGEAIDMCPHGRSLGGRCPDCINEQDQAEEDRAFNTRGLMDALEDKIQERLPKLAESLSELTYGEMVQFAHEAVSGKIVDPLTFDPMEAGVEAQVLARNLHVWLTKRRSIATKEE